MSGIPAGGTWLVLSLALVAAGQRHEGNDLAAENVGARDRRGAVRADLLDHFEDMLRPGRTNRNDHDPRRLQLLQQRRRDMVDAAGDDDLVERRRLLPAVIAIAILGRDRGIFAITRADQAIVDAPRAPGELG